MFLIYVLNAWTPSHYGEAAQMLGIPHSGPVFGDASKWRSDEFAVVTPYYQIAVASDLGPRDVISPYKEPLKTFFALPSRDWSMVFKPDLWGFLVLDPAHAYSLHYALLAAAMLGGFAVVLRQLGCSPGFAVAASAMLFLSQFVQVWWTSNAPVFAFAPWPVAACLWRTSWWARLPAIAYAMSAWLIGELYPPFIVASGLALGILVAAFRPDALRPGRLAPALAAAALGVGIAWLHYADLIAVMGATVYPGHRVNDGGAAHGLQLLAHLFPYLVSARYEPLGLWGSNACEIAVVGSFLPLAGLVFCDHRALAGWARAHRRALGVWLLGLLALLAWMVLPIPGRLAPVLNMVPPFRMLWGFGLLWLLGLAVIFGSAPWRLTPRRVAVFVGIVLAAWAVSKLALSRTPLAFGRFDLAAAPILVVLLAIRARAPHWLPPRRLVALALVLTAAVTFGRFNPVQSARPIFAHRHSPVVDTFAAYARANPRGWVVTPAMYGSVINGAGVPAINHTLLQPQPGLFRRAYPDLEAAAFNELFNRYEHVMLTLKAAPSLAQADLAVLPIDPFAIPLPLEFNAAAPAGPAASGHVDELTFTRLGPRLWAVVATGWAPWAGVAAGQRLQVAVDPGVGRIVRGHAFRLPRPDVVMARRDPQAFAAGFGARFEIETIQVLPTQPDGALSFGAADPGEAADPLPGTPG